MQLTSLRNDCLSTVHLHLVPAKQASLDALVGEVKPQLIVVEDHVPDGLYGKEVLQETVEVASVANVVETNW